MGKHRSVSVGLRRERERGVEAGPGVWDRNGSGSVGRRHKRKALTSEPAMSRRRRTTCCQRLRNSSILTGLIRKSTAPCVTPLRTVVVSPLEDITARGWGKVGRCRTWPYTTGVAKEGRTDDGKV